MAAHDWRCREIRGWLKNYSHSCYVNTSIGRTVLIQCFVRGRFPSSRCCEGINVSRLFTWDCSVGNIGRTTCDLHVRATCFDEFFVVGGCVQCRLFLHSMESATDDDMEHARELTLSYTHVTVDDVANHFQVSQGSVYAIIYDRLGFRKVGARWVVKRCADKILITLTL
ncbi:unnamed protein product [Ixodes pacificus]